MNATLMVFLGKCQDCKARAREVTKVLDREVVRSFSGRVLSSRLSVERADGRQENLNAERPGIAARCACGGWAFLSPIIARTTKHECGPKCRNARGHDCECSCGGVHHGEDV